MNSQLNFQKTYVRFFSSTFSPKQDPRPGRWLEWHRPIVSTNIFWSNTTITHGVFPVRFVRFLMSFDPNVSHLEKTHVDPSRLLLFPVCWFGPYNFQHTSSRITYRICSVEGFIGAVSLPAAGFHVHHVEFRTRDRRHGAWALDFSEKLIWIYLLKKTTPETEDIRKNTWNWCFAKTHLFTPCVTFRSPFGN